MNQYFFYLWIFLDDGFFDSSTHITNAATKATQITFTAGSKSAKME
jgi:hypothetical protein